MIPKTSAELEAEIEALKKRIRQIEAQPRHRHYAPPAVGPFVPQWVTAPDASQVPSRWVPPTC